MNVTDVFCHDVYGVKWFEVRIEGFGSIDIMLQTAKALGITKTLNGTKKLRAWLQTEEGKAYILRQTKRRKER